MIDIDAEHRRAVEDPASASRSTAAAEGTEPGGGRPPTAAPDLFVYEQGRWFSTPAGGNEPTEVDPPADGIEVAVPSDGASLVAHVEHGALPVVVQRRGTDYVAWDRERREERVIDGVDLRLLQPDLLDAAPGWLRFPDAHDRLCGLARCGLVAVRIEQAPDPAPASSAPPLDAEADAAGGPPQEAATSAIEHPGGPGKVPLRLRMPRLRRAVRNVVRGRPGPPA